VDSLGRLASVDYLVLGVYFVSTLAAGFWLSRKAAEGIDAYFLGGRRLPWWAIGMSGTASNFDMTEAGQEKPPQTVAAAMSTFDSTINAGVSYWVKDIYQRYLRPGAGRRQLMRQSYVGTVALAALAILLALSVRNIDQIWAWITGPLALGLFVPIVLRWYWWRLNGYGFALATAAGLLVSVWSLLLHKWSTCAAATLLFVLSGGVLYFAWYRGLPPEPPGHSGGATET
jgi:Na+/proline symporter